MIPAYYDYQNTANAAYSPSMVHFADNITTRFYEKYLFEDAVNTIKTVGIPGHWDKNYYQYILFGCGFLTIFEHNDFGVIPQNCTLSGYNVFYNPAKCIITNPVFTKSYTLEIGKDCELVKLQPNYSGVGDIVKYYAEKLALLSSTFDSTALNSKLAYLFVAKNKNTAESFKKMYDKIASGEPIAVVDKEMVDPQTGHINIEMFSQNVRENYIANDVLSSMTTVLNQFRTAIGIPNAEYEKRERLIVDEINSNNAATQNKHELWIETLNDCYSRVNNMFGLNLKAISNIKTENINTEVKQNESDD